MMLLSSVLLNLILVAVVSSREQPIQQRIPGAEVRAFSQLQSIQRMWYSYSQIATYHYTSQPQRRHLISKSRCLYVANPPPLYNIPECDTDDLLSCDFPEVVSASALCCNDSSLCVEYTGTSVGSSATYTTSEGLCITTELVRTCSQNNTWDGQTPTTKEGTYYTN